MSAWHELVIEGRDRAMDDLLAAHQESPEWASVRGSEIDLATETLLDRILEFLDAQTHHLLYAPADHAETIARAVAESPDLKLTSRREILEAYFRFQAETFNRDSAAAIQTALESLPEGVQLVGLQQQEETDPSAAGVELYSPEHDYIFRASGRVHGPFPGALEMHRRLKDLDFVKAGKLHLVGRDPHAAVARPPDPHP